MDSLRHIPQVFFEFFARLLPGFAALVLWLWLFGGAAGWRALLDTMVAGKLDANNAVSAAALVGVSGCYLVGQLIAPFGKLTQSISEWLDIRVRAVLKAKPASENTKADYDWLRANFPDQGALVAKIRAEYTMFYAFSATFVAASGGYACRRMPAQPGVVAFLTVMAMACALRGLAVRKTYEETATKLRRGIEERLQTRETPPVTVSHA